MNGNESGQPSGKAIASLVFGILGLTGHLPCIGSFLAIVLGLNEERGLGRAGRILGWVGLAFLFFWVLFALVVGVVAVGASFVN